MSDSGYFHWRKRNEVLTAYYEVSPTQGYLAFSSSLWKKQTKQEFWCKKKENANAFENFHKENPVIVGYPVILRSLITDFKLKLNDFALKRFIHRELTSGGREHRTLFDNDIPNWLYLTVEECAKARGHTYVPGGHRVDENVSVEDLLKNQMAPSTESVKQFLLGAGVGMILGGMTLMFQH